MLWILAFLLQKPCALATYERSLLMTAVMQPSLDPLGDAFETHMLETREAMAGAGAGGGIPCGCN